MEQRQLSQGSWVNWFTSACCYFGSAQLCGSLGSNLYVSFALSALTQQPSVFVTFFTLNYVGRKWSLFISNTLATISLFCIIFVPMEEYKIIPAVFAMFALGMSYIASYVYTVELFPTPVRTIGLGSSSAVGAIGGMLSPIIVDLNRVKGWLPPVIFTIMMFCASLCILFMPETKGSPLPRTNSDLIRIMHKDKMNVFGRMKNGNKSPSLTEVPAGST